MYVREIMHRNNDIFVFSLNLKNLSTFTSSTTQVTQQSQEIIIFLAIQNSFSLIRII